MCGILYAQAQEFTTFDNSNSFSITALVLYELDNNGFYQKRENVDLDKVSEIRNIYAYNKKTQEIYCTNQHSNCVIRLHNNFAKYYQKHKSIPKLSGKDLEAVINDKTEKLENVHASSNSIRQKEIEEARLKAIADSINRAREDSIRLVKLSKQKDDYRNSHNWRWVPINKTRLSCSLCDKTIYNEDSLLCIAFKNDTLYHLTWEDIALDETCATVHKYHVPKSLKTNDKFKFHFDVYGDSLISDHLALTDNPEAFNAYGVYEAMQKVKTKAPNGYFEDWGWESEYGSVGFNFKYTNTNKNTIKYIEVFWVITNDVGDVRKTGSFKGTGPLGEWETASWNWDYSTYYVAGDATKMNISKVIITYMNGSKVTIPKSKLQFN